MSVPTQPNTEPIPGYRLLERLGRGGYGEVWKCEAPGGILKAIKFVFGDLEGFGDSGQAAEQEYKSLNRVKTIRHPFILSLERFDIIDGQLLIVMELADRNLWDRFNECVLQGMPGIPHDELLKYLEEAAEALDLMNGHYQIQHLDIKPQNLFLVHNHIKVADFGLAKDLDGARAAVTGGVTPTYAPPETFEGWVSRHSDQYSLAIVYQEMLTGRRPFNGTNTRQLILQHLSAAPDLSPLNESNREAVARALSKIPTDRYPTCTAFIKALKEPNTPAPVPEGSAEQLMEMVTPRSTSKKVLPHAITPPLFRTSQDQQDPNNKKLPSLVTPGQRENNLVAPITIHRPLAPDTKHLQKPSAPLERRGEGVLCPVMFVGLGGCGLRTLSSLRGILQTRYDRDRLPNIRWLAIDTDPGNVESFLHGGGWETEEVVLTRLQRPTHYLHREGLPSVEGWLPSDLLYQMPRSYLTEGNRAFGRLALCDHYQIVCHRVRGALEAFLKPEGVLQADKITQLGFRTNMPRIYLVGSLAGGTASGMMIDLAYLIRRELLSMGFAAGHVLGMFGLPPLRSSAGYQNAKAAIRELAHFESTSTTYQSVFDTREKPLIDKERPFRRCQLVPNSDSLPGGRPVSERMAGLLHSEAFTQAGRLAHPDDGNPPANSFCVSTVTSSLWPHHVVVRTCANQLNRTILGDWCRPGDGYSSPQLDTIFEGVWAERDLSVDSLRNIFLAAAKKEFGQSIVELVGEWLEPLRNRDKKNPPDSDEVTKVIHRILDVVGRVGREEEEFPGRVKGVLQKREKEWILETDTKLVTSVVMLIEQPSLRLPAADQFIRRLEERISENLDAIDRKILVLDEQTQDEYAGIFSLLGMTVNTGISRLGKRTAAFEETIGDVLEWAGRRLELQVLRRILSVYRTLRTNLPEYNREVQQCRTQLKNYIGQIPDLRGVVAETGEGVRMYFGEKSDSLAELADDVLKLLSLETRRELEQILQAKIRHEGRGLVNMCLKPKEYGESFLQLLGEQTRRILEPIIFEYGTAYANWRDDGGSLLSKAFDDSTKQFALLPGSVSPAITVVGLPRGEGTEELLNHAKGLAGGTAFVSSETSGELWIFRECRGVDPASLFTKTPGSLPVNEPTGEVRYSRKDIPWPKT
ncbi:tubulin-like doman-containing protein [Zavarzinella formosa]|uniref:tubulin-like doman-containing protein n=1 Tax=Zavarzinella formosa TaxID=360055 RepID=UPI00030EF952|nr:tubulin-like doman-containing protein [Zavarzinella formosa]